MTVPIPSTAPAVAVSALLVLHALAGAQVNGAHPASIAWAGAWYVDWSPVRPLADLPRPRPGDQVPLPPGFAPPTRIGLFWSGGNPGALARDVDGSYAEFQALNVAESGSYRRPLDPARAETRAVAGAGWRPLGARSAAIGVVVAGRQVLDPASPALFLHSFSSTPHVLADTAAPAMEHQFARLEGATGTRLGGWGLGIAAGYQIVESGGIATRIPRIARLAEPGLAAGAVRAVGSALELGVYGAWRATAESVQVIPRFGATHVYPFHGYAEPVRVDVGPGTGPYYRRMDREALALGGGVAGKTRGVRWVAYGERSELEERQTSDRRFDPRLDRWSATGEFLGAGGQAQAGRLGLTVRLRSVRVQGLAHRHDLEEPVFRSDETVRSGAVEARLPPRGPWEVAFDFSLAHENRLRHDEVARIRSEIETLVPGFATEITGSFGAGTAIGLLYGFRGYGARAGLPSPQAGAPAFRELVWPELLYYATPARAHAVELVLRWRMAGDFDILSRVAWSTIMAGQPAHRFAEMPEGSRSVLKLSVGARTR